jgi:hypothetical protein
LFGEDESSLFQQWSEFKAYKEKLESYQKYQNEALAEIFTRKFTKDDLLLLAFAIRSLSIISGFLSLVEDMNYLCAAPLVRMQLENFVKLLFIVKEPDYRDEIFRKTMEGKKWAEIKIEGNKRLTDRYLVKYAKRCGYPWAEDIYDKSCKFVHFSEMHFITTVQEMTENRRITFIFSDTGPPFHKDDWEGLLKAFDVISFNLCDAFHARVQDKKETFSEPLIQVEGEEK